MVIPVHYDTFEVIQQDPYAFAERVRAETRAKCVVLKPGETLRL
jgi:L-ascorbate metabolism protein UlaG (beta-lactamase superfamily)